MTIVQRLELQFWLVIIPLIRRSRLLRFIFARGYLLARQRFVSGLLIPATITILLGLATGYTLGQIIPQ